MKVRFRMKNQGLESWTFGPAILFLCKSELSTGESRVLRLKARCQLTYITVYVVQPY